MDVGASVEDFDLVNGSVGSPDGGRIVFGHSVIISGITSSSSSHTEFSKTEGEGIREPTVPDFQSGHFTQHLPVYERSICFVKSSRTPPRPLQLTQPVRSLVCAFFVFFQALSEHHAEAVRMRAPSTVRSYIVLAPLGSFRQKHGTILDLLNCSPLF